MYIVSIITGINSSFSVVEALKSIFPYVMGVRWFVVAYIILFLLAPFINAAVASLTKKQYFTLIVILFVFFSLWPTFFSCPPLDDYGYSCNNLIFVYLIGGYIKLHSEKN